MSVLVPQVDHTTVVLVSPNGLFGIAPCLALGDRLEHLDDAGHIRAWKQEDLLIVGNLTKVTV